MSYIGSSEIGLWFFTSCFLLFMNRSKVEHIDKKPPISNRDILGICKGLHVMLSLSRNIITIIKQYHKNSIN